MKAHVMGAICFLATAAGAAEPVQYIVFNRAPGLGIYQAQPETTVKALRMFLDAAEQTSTPIVVEFDSEHWWDAMKPGFDPANRENVEWTDQTVSCHFKRDCSSFDPPL